MDYMTLKEASEKWGVSSRQINYYCTDGRIPGAVKMAGVWLIPKEAEKPMDKRRKCGAIKATLSNTKNLMKQPTFCGRELLPRSVFEAARAGDPLAMERILRYYDGYMNKLCTRTLYELDGTPHVRVDEYMKHRLQNKLIRAILKDSL